MRDTLFFTTAYFQGDEWHWWRESCQILGLNWDAYGVGKSFPGLPQAKIVDMLRYLESKQEEYVCFADGYDSFFTYWDHAKAMEILGDSSLIVACEDNCYPDTSVAERYPPSPWPWRFMCPGQFFGKREYVLQTLEILQREYMPKLGGMDQEHWVLAFLDGKMDKAKLDNQCQLFQTMSGPSGRFVVQVLDGRAANVFTMTMPMNIHFNGRVQGIEEWFNKWKEVRLAAA